MYKVLIVDDEVLVRVGIKSTIDWESLGFTVAAEASNGEQAYEAYRLHRPEVILTDIRMPKKDGLWLTKMIRQEDLRAKILILTCYNDFDYAREALKNGANDYILKSEVEDEELIKAITAARESLDSELTELERSNYLKKQIDTNIAALKENLLDSFLKSDFSADEKLFARCADLGFPLNEQTFVLMTVIRDDAERGSDFTEKEWRHMNNAIMNMASGIMKDRKMSYLARENNSEFIFLLSKGSISEEEVLEAFKSVSNSVLQYFDVPLSAVVSGSFRDIREVPDVYRELCQKAEELFYIDESAAIKASGRTFQDINIFSVKKNYGQLLISHIDEEDEERAIEVLAQTAGFFRQTSARVMEVKLFYSDMVGSIFERYHHCFGNKDGNRNYAFYHARIMSGTKLKSITKLIKGIITTVIRDIRDYRLGNSNNIIRKAKDYIEKNYNREISLRFLSGYLNLSKHYICYLFKKETGDNISLFVNKLRIEKAKQLVLDSDCKIKEIYDRVGFSDPQYFCKTFKKLTGMTVVQYRDSVLKKARKIVS